jgi:hypothetical protein
MELGTGTVVLLSFRGTSPSCYVRDDKTRLIYAKPIDLIDVEPEKMG